MKKTVALLMLTIAFTFNSCQNEPLEGDFDEGENSCEIALANTTQAALNFAAANVDNYNQVCTSYRNAIQIQIQVCGDPDGNLQLILDTLGNCTTIDVDDCQTATATVETAQFTFENASDADYTNACTAYRLALEAQIFLCGDLDGSIQAIIDSLGDCVQTTLEVEISLNAGAAPLQFDMVSVVVEGDLLKVTGLTSATATYMVYFEVAMNETGQDIINETFELTLLSTFFPSTQGFDDFTSNITVNTQDSIQGTFSGIVTNADGGDLSLTSGMINITY